MDSCSLDPEKDCDATCNEQSLEILKEVQRAYEDKMGQLENIGGPEKLQMQVELLRAWVDDLVGQNSLLAQTVTELEQEATSSLQRHRQRFIEMASEHRAELCALQRRLRRKDADLNGLLEVLRRLRDFDYYTLDGIHFHEITASDIFGAIDRYDKPAGAILSQAAASRMRKPEHPRGLWQTFGRLRITPRIISFYSLSPKENRVGNDTEQDLLKFSEALQKDNVAKDREIRRLSKELQQHEVLIMELQKEINICRCNSTPVPSVDADVMVGMSWLKQECGDMEPVRDRNLPIEDTTYQDRMKVMDTKLKATNKSMRALRKANVTLSFELYATRCVCAALGEECAAAKMNANFKDDIVREMRRQLKQAKAKLSKTMDVTSLKPTEFEVESTLSFDSGTTDCIREQPRQQPRQHPLQMSWPQPRALSDTDCHSSRYGE